MQPHYTFSEFQLACKKSKKLVIVSKNAMISARKDFDMNTKEDVINSIADDSLKELSHINTTLWDKNPNKNIYDVLIDAYSFRRAGQYGYLAFRKAYEKGKWAIKSFKSHEQSSPTIKNAFSKAFERKYLEDD